METQNWLQNKSVNQTCLTCSVWAILNKSEYVTTRVWVLGIIYVFNYLATRSKEKNWKVGVGVKEKISKTDDNNFTYGKKPNQPNKN